MKKTELFDKQYLKRVLLYVLSAVFAIAVVIYVGYHLIDRFSPGLEFIAATPKTVVRTVVTDAYIMRDETPLYATGGGGGSVAPAVHDGEKIAINTKVADVYSANSPDDEMRINEINEQIQLLEKSKLSDRSVQSAVNLDAAVYSTLFDMRSDIANGQYADALSKRVTLLVDMKKRSILTGEITDYDEQIRLLESEKASLMSKLGHCLETVFTTKSGYYFADCDGYGEIFSSDKVDSLTYDDFISLTKSQASGDGRTAVGTIVNDFRWYIAAKMSKTDAASLADKSGCSVLFRYSGISLEMKLYRIINETPGKNSVVIFACDTMPDGFDYTRMQPVEIEAVEYRGFEVPLDSVRVVDGMQGVYVLEESTIGFRRINIIYQNEGTVLCTGNAEDFSLPIAEPPEESESISNGVGVKPDEVPWIQMNDFVVVSGRELYSGKVLD